MSQNEPIKLDFGRKLGQVELKEDGGIQKKAFRENDQNSGSIFTHYDKDQNNILDEKELQQLYKDIENAAGKNKKLTADEAVKFLKNLGIDAKGDKARDIIKKFIGKIGSDSDAVESAEVKDDTITVKYKDNERTEVYIKNSDGKAVLREATSSINNTLRKDVYGDNGTLKEVLIEDSEKNTKIHNEFDEDGNLSRTTITTSREDSAQKTESPDVKSNGSGNEKLSDTRTMETVGGKVILKDGNDVVTLEYDSGGHIIGYAKEGENFKATANRLGIDVNDEEKYNEFCKLNAKALKRSHGGWFKIGEKVILPEGFEDKLNVREYEVNVKAEEAKYSKAIAEVKKKEQQKVLDELKVNHKIFNNALRKQALNSLLDTDDISMHKNIKEMPEVKDVIKNNTLGKKYDEAINTLIEFKNTNEQFKIIDGTITKKDNKVEYTYKYAQLTNGKYIEIRNYGTYNMICFTFDSKSIQEGSYDIAIYSDGKVLFDTNPYNKIWDYDFNIDTGAIPYERLYDIAKSRLGEPKSVQ